MISKPTKAKDAAQQLKPVNTMSRREWFRKTLFAGAGLAFLGTGALSFSGCGMSKDEKKQYVEKLSAELGSSAGSIGQKRLEELAELSREYKGLSPASMAGIVSIRMSLEGGLGFEKDAPTEEMVLQTLMYNTEWLEKSGNHDELFRKQIDAAVSSRDLVRADRLTRILEILGQFYDLPPALKEEIAKIMYDKRPLPE